MTYYETTKLPLIAVQQSQMPTKSHADVESPQNCDVDASIKRRVVSRVERIKVMCSKYRVKDRITRFRFLVSSDRHRVLYCPMFKVGSTTFTSLMYDEPNTKRAHSLNLNRNTLSEEEVEYRLKNYFKFMVVRHPFDRLLSAYSERFNTSGNFSFAKKYANVLHKHFVSELKIDSNGTALPSLEQFLHLVLTEPVTFRNHHWLNYNEYCHPCLIPYDHVVYMETFQDDIDIILDHFVDSNGSRPELTVNVHLRRAHKDRLQDTSTIFKKIDRKIIDKLLSVYHQDFEVFGYTWNYSYWSWVCPRRLLTNI